MSLTESIVEGTLKPDGSLELDQAPSVAPGRVQTSLYRTALGEDGANKKLYDSYRSIQPEHIAELIAATLNLPDYVNVSRLEVFPTDQAPGGSQIVANQ